MNKAVKAGTSIAGIFFLILGLIIGGCFTIVSIVMQKSTEDFENKLEAFRPYAEVTSGYVEESYDGYTMLIYSDKEGNEYVKSYNMSSSNLEGTTVTVYYDKDTPSECMVPDVEGGVLRLLGNIFKIIGIAIIAIFCGIGIAIICVGTAASKKIAETESHPANVPAGASLQNTAYANQNFTNCSNTVIGKPDSSKPMTEFEEAFYDSVNQKTKPDYGGVNKDLL